MVEYLKIYLDDKTVYFMAEIIKSDKPVYQAFGFYTYDYYIDIKAIYFINDDIAFEDNYGGIFLCIDNDNHNDNHNDIDNENKKIRLYDNIDKSYIDVKDRDDCSILRYKYNNHSDHSLDYIVKEIFYDIIINN
jgi:hypothetical protein